MSVDDQHYFVMDYVIDGQYVGSSYYVFNLFTSFGYFDREEDNIKTLLQIKIHLTSNGFFVLDYLNVNHAMVMDFEPKMEECHGIIFKTQKRVENKFIFKKIEVIDQGVKHYFEEKVQLLTLDWFKATFEKINFEIVAVFGDYELNVFDKINSKRLILIVENKKMK